jgi:CarD family transcriptional regulator
MPEIKKCQQRFGFKTNEYVVYPTHGVGRIVAIEEQEIAGCKLELFVITFEKDKMTLRLPTSKTESAGMRKLSDESVVARALETLKGRARIKRAMWSRRAQEYEAKINSGDLIAIAEVVRDLYRSDSQPEQSYSERQLYEAALDRMARELSAAQDVDESIALQRVAEALAKGGKMQRKVEELAVQAPAREEAA